VLSSGIDAVLCCLLGRTCGVLLYCRVLYCHYSIEWNADIDMLDIRFFGRKHSSHAEYRNYRFRSRDLEEVLDRL
jgi:hypothetical protein